MRETEKIKNKIFDGETIGKNDAAALVSEPLEELCSAADEIRRRYCGDRFDICTIVNAKSGRCSENCKFCAQSSFYGTSTCEYPLMDTAGLLELAEYNDRRGVLRYSFVTSGKKLSGSEIDKLCESIREIRSKCGISICASVGLVDEEAFRKLKAAGVKRVHNNLETSRRFFPSVCTTHSYDEKLEAIRAARRAGLEVCSGGIVGLGETMEDRIDMALEIRSLGVRSVPLNILNPIPGTPFESNTVLTNDEVRRIAAIFRFILPDASIRLAGGRGLLPDRGRACFKSGANAAISGDMLTTTGITIEEDMSIIKNLGYKAVLCNE